MKNTLRWRIPGQEFEDGSQLKDWHKIESTSWHLQFESNYEMTFNIYQHDGQLRRSRRLYCCCRRSLKLQSECRLRSVLMIKAYSFGERILQLDRYSTEILFKEKLN